jgi:hypothetical protein
MKKMIMLLACLHASSALLACDICGGGGQWLNTGLQPQFSQHYIGFNGSMRNYFNPPTIHDPMSSEDRMNSSYLMGRYSFSDKFQFGVSLPFIQNKRLSEIGSFKSSGLGDVQLQISSLWVNRNLKGSKTRFFLQSNCNARVPVGGNQVVELPIAMQKSMRSFGLGAGLNMMLANKRIGMSQQINYFYSFKDVDQFKIGDQLTGTTQIFGFLTSGNITFAPHVQCRITRVGQSFEYDYPVTSTNEFRVNGGFGLDVYGKHFGIISQVFLSGWERQESTLPNLKNEIVVSFIYLIGQNEK